MRGKKGFWGRKGLPEGRRSYVASTQGLSNTQTVEIGVHLGWVWEGKGSIIHERGL